MSSSLSVDEGSLSFITGLLRNQEIVKATKPCSNSKVPSLREEAMKEGSQGPAPGFLWAPRRPRRGSRGGQCTETLSYRAQYQRSATTIMSLLGPAGRAAGLQPGRGEVPHLGRWPGAKQDSVPGTARPSLAQPATRGSRSQSMSQRQPHPPPNRGRPA